MRDRYTGRFFDEDMEGEPRRHFDEIRRYDEPRHYEPRHHEPPPHYEQPRRFEEPHWRRDMHDREQWAREDRWRADRDRDRWMEGQRAPHGMGHPRGMGHPGYVEEAGYGRTFMDEGRVELGPRHTNSFVPRRVEPQRRYPRGPKGYRRSDERVKEDVCDRLYHSLDLDSSDVEVKVQSGEVILTGTVPERAMKYRIESTIEDVSGVIDVTNQIRVKQPHQGREWNEHAAADGTPENGRRPVAGMPRS
ncbi:MAG: BON domain-containing protein [Polyangiaceae bacterium]|nr:BON domain-containing protein [Polyangiaceae bacterium]